MERAVPIPSGGTPPVAMRKEIPNLTYQLKITILDVRPPVWRRVRVPGNASLGELHDVIQTAFGWTNSHLHGFEIGGKRYGPPGDELESEILNEEQVSLTDAVGRRVKRFGYTYDFGDDWRHEVIVEKVEPAGSGEQPPVCVAGKRHGPPEDCGGPWGYAGFLEAMRNPKHEQHEEMMDWFGGPFDPEAFDLAAVNTDLAKLNIPSRGLGRL